MKNSKRLFEDESLSTLENLSDDLIARSSVLSKESTKSRDELARLYDDSERLISYTRKLIEDKAKNKD